jgi:protein-disulfide isomerase-like protein with CxxC motif
MKITDTIFNQHAENATFMEKLFFYKDEIAIMKTRIAEVASKNSSKDVLSQIEHFQNQLIVQNDNIDRIKHEIGLNEKSLEANINKNEIATDHRKVADHTFEREQVEGFEKHFNELRAELKTFLAKWM